MRIALLLALLAVTGCGALAPQPANNPRDEGLVILVPGIAGVTPFDLQMREGLQKAGVQKTIVIYPWGWPIPVLGMALNQSDVLGNRANGDRLARFAAEFHRKHPAAPIFIVGRSGGAGIALFAAESFPKYADKYGKIDGLVLLSASVSADYNIAPAVNNCYRGVLNFFNEEDIAMLQVGTGIMGNIDGGHGESAGRTGFTFANAGADLDYSRLFQIKITLDMIDSRSHPHFADTTEAFAREYIAPWIKAADWPPSGGAR